MADIIDAVDYATTLKFWVKEQIEKNYPEKEHYLLLQLDDALNCWAEESENLYLRQDTIPTFTDPENNTAFYNLLAYRPPKQQEHYLNGCYIFYLLIELAEYHMCTEDIRLLDNYFKESFPPIEEIKQGSLFGVCSDQFRKGIKNKEKFRCVAEDAFSGCIRVDCNGELINWSRFPIEPLPRPAVKVELNSMFYAILLENGELIHNLDWRYTEKELVGDFHLEGDHLICQKR